MGNTKHALIPEAAPSPAAEILDDLITTAEAAQLSNCVPENIRALARRGVIPIVAKVGRGQSLFSRRLILERVAAKRAGTRSER